MSCIGLEIENSTAQRSVGIGRRGELELGFVGIEAGALPGDGRKVRRDSANEGREEIDSAVEGVEEGPGDLARKDGKDVLCLKRNRKGVDFRKKKKKKKKRKRKRERGDGH